jgi:amino acid permease
MDVDVTAGLGQSELVFTVANTLIGASVLNLPYAAAHVGPPAAVFVLLVVTSMMMCTARFIVLAIRKRPRGADVEFGDLAEVVFGAIGRKIVDFALVFELWLALVGCFDLVGSNLSVLLPISTSAGVVICSALLLVLFVVPPKALAALSFVSVMAMCTIFAALVVTVAEIPTWASEDQQYELNYRGVFLMIGVSMTGYAGHPCLPSFYVQAKDKAGFLCPVSGGFGVAVVYYTLMGLIGSIAFGSCVAQNITESVGHDLNGNALNQWSVFLQKLCAGALALKIQVVCILITRPVLNALGAPKEGWGPRLAFAIVTCLVALYFTDQIASVMALVGLLPTMCTSIIFPLTLHLFSGNPSRLVSVFCCCGILCGAGLAVVGTCQVLFGEK